MTRLQILFVLALLGFSFACLVPGDALATVRLGSDKLVHFMAWAVIAALAGNVFKTNWTPMVVLIAWGVALEIVQQWVPSRSFELLDIVANSLGVLVGIGIARQFNRKSESSQQES